MSNRREFYSYKKRPPSGEMIYGMTKIFPRERPNKIIGCPIVPFYYGWHQGTVGLRLT
ncbi:MAG TPA: hypothetical protein VI278_08495 [Nitrososphaeraceae archaeon]